MFLLYVLLAFPFLLQITCQQQSFDHSKTTLCGLDLYDVSNLVRAKSWQVTSRSLCLDTWNVTDSCSYIFSFCKPLSFPGSACNGGAVCQIDDGKGSTEARKYKIGSYNTGIDPFINTINGAVGFTAQYAHGEVVKNPKTNVSGPVGVAILFRCNDKFLWNVDPNGPSPAPVPGNVTVEWNPRTFTYWIHVEYAGACLSIDPISPTGEPIDPSLPKHLLSAGTVLIIILVCITTLYCVLGCIAKACMGSKGAEIIPNHNFWKELPGYTKDGCGYVGSCGCCKTSRVSEPFAKQTGYDSI